MSDLDTLVDMGFDREKSQLALKSGGNLQGAIDYLDKNAEKTVEELKEDDESTAPIVSEPGAEARSLICNICQRQFRTTASAEAHAEKTEHQDFSESTEELAPLTEAEKSERLAEARARAAARRLDKEKEDKIEAKRNEQIKRKATKESADMKEELARKEQIKEAQAKKREKAADIDAKKRVQAQIARDKAERKEKAEKDKAQREGQTFPADAVAATLSAGAAAALARPAGAAHTEARLRLQTPSGNLMKSFPAETTLFEVAHAVADEKAIEVTVFESTFPRKKWERVDFGMTVREAGWVPSASIVVR